MDINHTSPDRAGILRAILAGTPGNAGAKQCARLLEAMERLGSVTTIEAARFLDAFDPPARKRDLVKGGHRILMTWDRGTTEAGESHKVGRYSLVRGVPS